MDEKVDNTPPFGQSGGIAWRGCVCVAAAYFRLDLAEEEELRKWLLVLKEELWDAQMHEMR